MKKTKEKGITLVALVITIIILLILAGITIGALSGENGLISKVNQAKKAQIKAEMKEALILAINELQLEKEGKATLDDIKPEWADKALKNYNSQITSDASINGKKVTMKKSGVTGKYIIDENLNITEVENDSSIEFSYEVFERKENMVSIRIRIQDKENGLSKIELPGEGPMTVEGNKKREIGIDYEVKLGVEYKIKITSENGQTKEETIFITDYWYDIKKDLGEGAKIEDNTSTKAAYNKPYKATIIADDEYIIDTITVTMGGQKIEVDKSTGVINIEKVTGNIEITVTTRKFEIQVTDPYIGTSLTETNSINSVVDNSQIRGETLYINFSATLEGQNCTITYKEDDTKKVPFKIVKNGKYYFIVTGTYNGKTLTKEVEVVVNKYTSATGVVKYDAGEWTKEEIEELQSKSLYSLNGSNYTFNGFTYKGSSYDGNDGIVTNRNQSASCNGAGWGNTPKYEGWQILEGEKIDGKTYVTKLVHAGSPENFAGPDDLYGGRQEYILSSGTRQLEHNKFPDGSTINPRDWDMYKDKDLDEKGCIKDVHLMTLAEATEVKQDEIIRMGKAYFLATAGSGYGLCCVNGFAGGISSYGTNNYAYNWGIRPVISLTDGVYIASGTGTDTDPYVLSKE